VGLDWGPAEQALADTIARALNVALRRGMRCAQ